MGPLILGIDPGSQTGYVLVRTEPLRILEHGTIPASSATDPDRADEATYRRLATLFGDLAAHYEIGLVAMEQPIDAKPFWSAQKGTRREGTGTSFRSGVYYGLTRAAVPQWIPFVSYPVHGFGKRNGWMPARAKRPRLLASLRLVAQVGGAGLASDHELMALGVAMHALHMRVR